jgi:hypothetical protein
MALPLAAGLAGWIVAGLASGVGQIVAKTLVSLGIGYASYTGMNALVDMNQAQILALLNTLPPTTVQLIGVLKVGVCLNIWFSAFLIKLTLWGMNSDTITRMRVLPGGTS